MLPPAQCLGHGEKLLARPARSLERRAAGSRRNRRGSSCRPMAGPSARSRGRCGNSGRTRSGRRSGWRPPFAHLFGRLPDRDVGGTHSATAIDERVDVRGRHVRAPLRQIDQHERRMPSAPVSAATTPTCVNRPGDKSVNKLYGDGFRISSQSPGCTSTGPSAAASVTPF